MSRPFVDAALGAALAIAAACGPGAGGFETDTGSGSDTGECESGGTWEDPGTGLTWQDGPACGKMDCAAAIDTCAALDLGGRDDWRLPGVDELRSLVRGCAAIESGGACGVTDDCLQVDCWDLVCYGCGAWGGPGPGGCYWDPGLSGECGTYWAAPIWSNGAFDACWHIDFGGSYLNYVELHEQFLARCVRGPGA